MEKRWLPELPLVKVIVPVIAGIMVFSEWKIRALPMMIAGIILFALFLYLHFKRKTWRYPFLSAGVICGLLFLCAGGWTRQHVSDEIPLHFSKYPATHLLGYVVQAPEEKDNSYKTVIAVDSLIDSSAVMHDVEGKLLVYFAKARSAQQLRIGDKILLPAAYKPVDPPKNPAQFDYKSYLARKHIHHQAYAGERQFVVVQNEVRFFIRRASYDIAVFIQNILQKYIPGKDRFALADGILLGHRSDIDPDLYQAFAYTGILHILSVSGLHVGIVYALLAFLLGFIPDKNNRVRVAKFACIVLFIWLFAFITGLGAAVVRAAILFTLLNFGQIKNEYTNSINLLSGSALIQLLLDPMQLYDIGFQLSYLAMLGIFLLNKRIYSLYYSKHKLADWTWKLWATSIAAQAFTLPLSLYYFGNFPLYFLIANIFAIPLSTVILCLSIVLIPAGIFPPLAMLLGKITGWVIYVFIELTLIIADLPYGKMNNIYIGKLQVVLLFLAVSMFCWFLLRTHYKALITGCCLMMISIGISFAHKARCYENHRIIVYALKNDMVIGYQSGSLQYLFSFDSISQKDMDYNIKNSQRYYGISQFNNIILNDTVISKNYAFSKNLLSVQNKNIYFLDKTNSRLQFTSPLEVDYLVITGNMFLNVKELQENYRYKALIISPDNDAKHLRIFRKLLDAAKTGYLDLTQQAVEIKL